MNAVALKLHTPVDFSTPGYTQAQLQALKDAWNTGETAKEIGAMLSKMTGRRISRNAVIGLVHRHGDKLGLIQHVQYVSMAVADARRFPKQKRRKPRLVVVSAPPPPPPPPPPKPNAQKKKKALTAPNMKPVDIIQIRDSQCKYAVTKEAPHMFCGAPALPGQSWCDFHLENHVVDKTHPRPPRKKGKS